MDEKPKKNLFTVRFAQGLMVFFGVVAAYTMRINMSVGIVAMTNNSTRDDFPILQWDTRIKAIVLSSYFWGYVTVQMPAGLFCHKHGPKMLLFTAIFGCGVISLITPYVASNFSWKFVVASRVVLGLFQGSLFPCLYGLASKWAPPLERNRFFSFVFSGSQAGTVITLFAAGFLAASPGGWPSIFYVSGSLGILWALLWAYIGANSPAEHPFISAQERNFIESSLVHSATNNKSMKVPWFDICTSRPLWCILIAHFSQHWGYWTLLVLMPSYLSSVHHIDIKNNGLFSSLPSLVLWICITVFSHVADKINKRKMVSLSMAKKIWSTIGMWGGAVGMLGLTMTTSTSFSIILLIVTMALNFGVFLGFMTNHLDLGPNFASVLMGLTNSLSNIASFLAPLTAGVIIKDETDVSQWNTVFYISALIYFLGNLGFMLYGTADVQPWNEPKKTKEEAASEIPLTGVIDHKNIENGIEDNQLKIET